MCHLTDWQVDLPLKFHGTYYNNLTLYDYILLNCIHCILIVTVYWFCSSYNKKSRYFQLFADRTWCDMCGQEKAGKLNCFCIMFGPHVHELTFTAGGGMVVVVTVVREFGKMAAKSETTLWDRCQIVVCVKFHWWNRVVLENLAGILVATTKKKNRYFKHKHDLSGFCALNLSRPSAQRSHNIELKCKTCKRWHFYWWSGRMLCCVFIISSAWTHHILHTS